MDSDGLRENEAWRKENPAERKDEGKGFRDKDGRGSGGLAGAGRHEADSGDDALGLVQ